MTEAATDRWTFTFTVWYFKPSGKFYTEATFEREVRVCKPHCTPYMHDAVAHIRGIRDGGGGELPGLCGSWDGPIVINHEDGFPCLIPGRAE